MTKTVTASLDIQIWVDCPECEFLIDLMDEEDTDGVAHNDEGNLLSQACPNGNWNEKHKHFEVRVVTCSNCKHTFNVEGLEW